MKTEIRKLGDTIVVSMDGKLDFGSHEPLRADLTKLIRTNRTDLLPRKFIFDLEGLEFVGSSGISSFVQALKDFNTLAPTRPRYCHVKSEFQKVIKAFDDEDGFEFFENVDRARKSFDQ